MERPIKRVSSKKQRPPRLDTVSDPACGQAWTRFRRMTWLSEAEVEVINAARFDNGRAPGLGAGFFESVDAALAEVVLDPRRFGIVDDEIRRCRVKRSPYGIYFRCVFDTLRVLGVNPLKNEFHSEKIWVSAIIPTYVGIPCFRPCNAGCSRLSDSGCTQFPPKDGFPRFPLI